MDSDPKALILGRSDEDVCEIPPIVILSCRSYYPGFLSIHTELVDSWYQVSYEACQERRIISRTGVNPANIGSLHTGFKLFEPPFVSAADSKWTDWELKKAQPDDFRSQLSARSDEDTPLVEKLAGTREMVVRSLPSDSSRVFDTNVPVRRLMRLDFASLEAYRIYQTQLLFW